MTKVADIQAAFTRDNRAAWVANMWETLSNQRQVKMDEWAELKQYLFATDTSTTSNSHLPWKNTTTLPKLTQIRDNLHSNYLSALFPNDKWLKWEAYSKEAAEKNKKEKITAYMENKTRSSNFRSEASKLLYDYIDYGNAFAQTVYETRVHTNDKGEKVEQYVGPRMLRISPEDIVFNPLATSFEQTWKIVRSFYTLGEIKKMAEESPTAGWDRVLTNRETLNNLSAKYDKADFNKALQYTVDGFGNFYEYIQGGTVEVLRFFGDFHDPETGEVHANKCVVIADRCTLVSEKDIETYNGVAPIRHVGWRLRPDNMWAMGPLDNLVGMQYRIDHLENLKADAMDLTVHPPLKIIGQVEEFRWGPGTPIHIQDSDSDVQELGKNLNSIIITDNQIQALEEKMELYAGAPRQAMGIRTPGEKTALEVQTLENASGRIFQEKITHFEIELLEKVLNDMLESAHRNYSGKESVYTVDKTLGHTKFLEITKDDIVGKGIIRPVGARHFAQQAQELQNLIGIANSPLWEQVRPHVSGVNLTKFIEDINSIRSYEIFKPNQAVSENKETQALMNQASEDLEVQADPSTPTGPIG